MDISEFFSFILLALLVVLLSVGLDRLFARIAPFRLLYYALRFPGVVLHELAHVAGCVLTGAEIKKVVLFSETGGSVTYASPRIPVAGTIIISTAPLFLLPLVLAGLTWIFGTYFGCYVPPAFPSAARSATEFYAMVGEIPILFFSNLIVRFNGWFLVYVYLAGSITLSLAPSRQDVTHAAAGIALFIALCLLVFSAGSPALVTAIGVVIAPMATAFSIGLLYEMVTAGMSVPFILLHVIRQG